MAGSPLLHRVRNRVERARQHRWRMAPHRSPEAHIVLGGAPRSGTTLLRRLLDRHPEVCSGAETKLFVPAAFNLAWLAQAYAIPRHELEEMRRSARSQAAFIDAFAARVCAGSGKPRWAEKTPQNIRHLDWILEHFPVASVVHIIRDGRDVICSMREHPDWRWVDGAWQRVLVPRPLEWYAQRWLDDTSAGMARRRRSPLRRGPLRGPRGGPRVGPAGHLRAASGIATDEAWLAGAGMAQRGPGGAEHIHGLTGDAGHDPGAAFPTAGIDAAGTLAPTTRVPSAPSRWAAGGATCHPRSRPKSSGSAVRDCDELGYAT